MRRQWEKQMTAKRAKEWKTEPMALFQVELLQQHIFTATSNRITSTALISWIKPSEKKRKSHPSIKSTHFRLHCLMLKSFSTTLLLFLFVVFIIDSIHPIFCSHIWICKIKVGIECRSSSLLCKSNWIKRWNAKWKKRKRKTHDVPTTKIESGYQNADQVWAFCTADTFHDFSHQRFIWKVRKY